MSKLKLSEINFDDDEILVETEKKKEKPVLRDDFDIQRKEKEKEFNQKAQKMLDEAQLILNRAKDEAQKIVDDAKKEASEIKENNLQDINIQKQEIIEAANSEASRLIEEAKTSSSQEALALVEKSKEEIEQERIATIKSAYEEGHKDGLEKIYEELEEKIADFSAFCSNQYELRDKILKSANKDMLDLIINISKKILLKELNGETIDKIIKRAISLFEKKENITIILSQKYAKVLFEYQKKSLSNDVEFNFEDFKQYENFDIAYNPDFDDDTIIVENLKERFDASINSQLDVIVRDIYNNTKNGKVDLEQYENEAE